MKLSPLKVLFVHFHGTTDSQGSHECQRSGKRPVQQEDEESEKQSTTRIIFMFNFIF